MHHQSALAEIQQGVPVRDAVDLLQMRPGPGGALLSRAFGQGQEPGVSRLLRPRQTGSFPQSGDPRQKQGKGPAGHVVRDHGGSRGGFDPLLKGQDGGQNRVLLCHGKLLCIIDIC